MRVAGKEASKGNKVTRVAGEPMAAKKKSALATKTRESGKEEGFGRGGKKVRKSAIVSIDNDHHVDGDDSNNKDNHNNTGFKDGNKDDNADNNYKDNDDENGDGNRDNDKDNNNYEQ